MLGAQGCVRKRREVWLYKNARIHLDTVEGLGRFIEIEVVVTEGMPQARALMKELREVLGISAKDLIAGSYGELSGESARCHSVLCSACLEALTRLALARAPAA